MPTWAFWAGISIARFGSGQSATRWVPVWVSSCRWRYPRYLANKNDLISFDGKQQASSGRIRNPAGRLRCPRAVMARRNRPRDKILVHQQVESTTGTSVLSIHLQLDIFLLHDITGGNASPENSHALSSAVSGGHWKHISVFFFLCLE